MESAKIIQERFKNNYAPDKTTIKSSEPIWKDIEKVYHIGEEEINMTSEQEDEAECKEKLEELHKLLGHLKALKKDGQQANVDKKIKAVEKGIGKYFKLIEN